MPQVAQRIISTSETPFSDSAPTLLPGLSAPLLTGAGWIRLSFQANVYNPEMDPGAAIIIPEIDGVLIPPTAAMETYDTIAATSFRFINREWLYRLGAGNHLFRILGMGQTASMVIRGRTGIMNVWELGF